VQVSTLAHISDLHLGRSPSVFEAAVAACDALVDAGVDHVVATGDLTHRGRAAELEQFQRAFHPLLVSGRLTIVPGNHDRLGDDLGARIMGARRRVEAVALPGLYLVRVDSTGPHNRFLLAGHGALDEPTLEEIDDALGDAPLGALRALLLHHHVLPLPEETLPERIATGLGWPFAAELEQGAALIERVIGRLDLILHGHRHHPAARQVGHPVRPLGIYNAGSTTALGQALVFRHAEGVVLGEARWLACPIVQPCARPIAHAIDPREVPHGHDHDHPQLGDAAHRSGGARAPLPPAPLVAQASR
jgi:3',5'-cyclic AMP phosphodiesterase CpdA